MLVFENDEMRSVTAMSAEIKNAIRIATDNEREIFALAKQVTELPRSHDRDLLIIETIELHGIILDLKLTAKLVNAIEDLDSKWKWQCERYDYFRFHYTWEVADRFWLMTTLQFIC